jgi:DtxR family Mn-dependent transcriptional regulator
VGVQDHSPVFLQYLDRLGLVLGVQLEVLERMDYDESMRVRTEARGEQILTKKVCQHLFIQKQW